MILLIWQSVNPQLANTKKVCFAHFISTLPQFDTCKQTCLKPLHRGFQKPKIIFFACLFPLSLFLSLIPSLMHSISLNLQIRLSQKKASLNVSSITVIQLRRDLHNLRDHPSLFCMLRFSMAIFLPISEQQMLARSLPPPSCHTVETTLPGDPNPAPLHTHAPLAENSLTLQAAASLFSTKSRFTTCHSDERMSSTSADLLAAQSYKTAKHFPHQLMGVRSHFTAELSSIKQTEKHQGNIHVKSTCKHRCTLRPWEKTYRWV